MESRCQAHKGINGGLRCSLKNSEHQPLMLLHQSVRAKNLEADNLEDYELIVFIFHNFPDVGGWPGDVNIQLETGLANGLKREISSTLKEALFRFGRFSALKAPGVFW